MAERLRALGTGLASAIVAAALLVVPPVALVVFVGNPLPDRLPDPAAVLDALAQTGVSDDVVVNVLAVLAWLIWVQIAAALGVEVLAVARQRPTRRLLVLPGLQPLAASLVAAVLLIPAPWSNLRPTPESLHSFQPVTASTVDVVAAPVDRPSLAADQGPSQAALEYTVKRHDSFWSIAEAHLQHLGGSPTDREVVRYWERLVAVNVGRLVDPANPDLLYAGQVLELPPA